MKFVIREAEPMDFDAVFPLFRQLWPTKTIDREALRIVFERGAASETDKLFCLAADGEAAGFCAYAMANNLWQEGQIAYIYAMVVDESLRGQGLGTALLEHAIEEARRSGMKRVELDSGFPREKAHAFYQKIGFEKRAFLFSYTL